MGERDATQAAVPIRASSDVQDKMTSQITRLLNHQMEHEHPSRYG